MDVLIPVMIIDDEPLIRSLIRNSVDWEALGFRIVGEAEDGETALTLVEELRPRLLVVDINIPFVDGLELSQQVRIRYPDMVIIILTGYGEFRYAHRAIQVGVLDYILKPINPEEFRRTLVSARAAVLEGEEQRYSLETDRADCDPETGLKESFLRALVAGSCGDDPGEIVDRFRFFRIRLEPASLLVCLLDLRDPGGDAVTSMPEDLGSAGEIPYEVFPDGKGHVVLLLNEDTRTTRAQDRSCHRLCEAVRDRVTPTGAVFAAGVGGVVAAPQELCRSYREAETALDERFYHGTGKIFRYEQADAAPFSRGGYRLALKKDELLLLLRGGRETDFRAAADAVFQGLRTGRAPRQYCELICMEIVSVVMEFLDENDIPFADLLAEGTDALSRIQGMISLAEMQVWILRLAGEALHRVESHVSRRTKAVALKAKAFIERNYARSDLALEQIAEYIAVTPSYISSIFKKELGRSIIEYLTGYRLRKAKDLMDEDALITITDVAERVGYADPYYFSKCFRKQFGLAPSLYLRRKRLPAGK